MSRVVSLRYNLEWGSGKQQTSIWAKRKEILPALRLEILDVVSFIKNHINPRHTTEYVLISKDELIGSDANVEGMLGLPSMPSFFSFLSCSII